MTAPSPTPLRLTEFARGGGCAAKLRLGALSSVMATAERGAARADIIVDSDFSDDAAVVRPVAGAGAGGRDLVLTTDTIAPLVDDPEMFGAIAATNAMSDVWAMGGEPRWALNLVFFPDEQLPLSVLNAVLAGGARACAAAGVAIVGGHSVRDPELKYGLAVTGDVDPAQTWSNRNAHAGQAVILTKALGTGVLSQAIKRQVASDAAIAAAVASMTTLNAAGARIGRAHGATAATDVTGFGMIAHLRNICRGSSVSAQIELAAIPLLPDALIHMRARLCPGGSKANRAHVAPDTRWADGSPLALELADDGDATASEAELRASLACDAQTSGGLLLCVPADRADACVADLRREGLPAARVGQLTSRSSTHLIELA